jgi:hypothetical protein
VLGIDIASATKFGKTVAERKALVKHFDTWLEAHPGLCRRPTALPGPAAATGIYIRRKQVELV